MPIEVVRPSVGEKLFPLGFCGLSGRKTEADENFVDFLTCCKDSLDEEGVRYVASLCHRPRRLH